MSTGQRELGLRMVEGCRYPGTGGMADVAVRSELTLMGIILGVTGKTILGGSLQVGEATRPEVTGATFQLAVFAGQLKSKHGMIKIMPIGIDAIVASQAFLAIVLEMGEHEIRIELLMAGGAHRLIDICIAINMAGHTIER